MAPVIATGAPPPPAPSSSAPKAKAISRTCRRRSLEMSPTDCLTISNLPGLDRDVVDEDGGDHDPGDAEPAEHQAIGNGARHHVGGHPKTAIATTTAAAKPESAAFHAAMRRTANR